jgi:hypothetical protein
MSLSIDYVVSSMKKIRPNSKPTSSKSFHNASIMASTDSGHNNAQLSCIMTPHAAQQVFQIPELVAEIIHWLAETAPRFSFPGERHGPRLATLDAFSTINKTWWAETVRLSWRHVAHLANIFHRIPAKRRQQYADHVQVGWLDSTEYRLAKACDSALQGVRFPKLRRLNLRIVGDGRLRTIIDGVHIPSIQGEAVRILHIDGDEMIDVGSRFARLQGLYDDWVALFKRIEVTGSYPHPIKELN